MNRSIASSLSTELAQASEAELKTRPDCFDFWVISSNKILLKMSDVDWCKFFFFVTRTVRRISKTLLFDKCVNFLKPKFFEIPKDANFEFKIF